MSACDSDTEDEEAERFQLPVDFRRWQALAQKTPVVLLHQRTRTRLEKCIKRKASLIFLNTPPSSPSSSPPSSPRRRHPKRRNRRAQHRRSVNASRVAVEAAMQAASTANTHALKALRVCIRKANHRHMKSPAGPSEKFLREVINDGRRHRRPMHTKKHLPRWGAATNDTARMCRLRRLAYAAKVQEQHQEDTRHRPRKVNK